MKKRVLAVVLALGLVLTATGCGDKEKDTVKKLDESVAEETAEETEEENEEVVEEETAEESEEESVKKTGAVLGGDEEDFDNFEYMYPEELRTDSEENDETGKKESKKVTVLIPDSEYPSVNRDYAYVDELGVAFRVSLNPYLQYEQEDYLLSENLDAFLAEEYDEYYSTDYKNLEVSEVNEISDDAVSAEVNYVYYDDWDDMYVPIYKMYYVKELEEDLMVMVELEINLAETTGKTPELLEEISSFYEFDINWDKEACEKRVEDFLASDESSKNTVSTGYMIFELPEGWETDSEYGDYSAYAYAPGGDSQEAQCVLSIEREFTMDDYDVTELLTDPEYTKSMFVEMIDEEVSNIEVTDMDETSLGRTVKVYLDVDDEGFISHYGFYFAQSGDYLYTVYAVQTDDATEDAIAVAEEVITTAQLKED